MSANPLAAPVTKPSKSAESKNPNKQQAAEPAVDKNLNFKNQFSLTLGAAAAENWHAAEEEDPRSALLPFWKSAIPRRQGPEEVELSLGLDFGTSTVKVIISDKAQQRAFAVPFHNSKDSERYLLPSRLFLTARTASLEQGEKCYSDLKMRLIDDMDDRDNQIRTAILLALVLRHSINWFCTEHKETYATSALAWRLTLGFPSTQLNQHEHAYRRFIQTAWLLAHFHGPLTIDLASKAYDSIATKLRVEPDKNLIGIDFSIVPELAAQIYGYVSSDGFDPHDQKAFLLVDVGAGTVDAAVFRPSKSKGKTNYDFYTTTVEPNGVRLLHRNRLFWWRRALDTLQPSRDRLLKSVTTEIENQGAQTRPPPGVTDYFTECTLSFVDPALSPDAQFFHSYRHQVVTDTLFKAQEEGYWDKRELMDIPFYLCGGGSRMPFYRKLLTVLGTRHPNISWLKATPRTLVVPSNLIAPYLAPGDYDRMTVAYGLSLDDVGEVLKHQAAPKREPESSGPPQRPWWDRKLPRYVDKPKIELSGILAPGGSHEEVPFYRNPDRHDPQASRCRCSSEGHLSPGRD
jgi:hypothetical protein